MLVPMLSMYSLVKANSDKRDGFETVAKVRPLLWLFACVDEVEGLIAFVKTFGLFLLNFQSKRA